LSAAGWVPGEDLDLLFTNEMSNGYLLRSATFAIDGHAESVPQDRSGDAKPVIPPTRRVRMPPGGHTIEIELRLRANGYGILSYLRGYAFDVKSRHTVTVSAGKRVAVTATAFEDGGVTDPFDRRPKVAWQQKAW